MGSLQAALPNGPLSMPNSVAPTSSNDWSMGLQPASYPQGGGAGIFQRLLFYALKCIQRNWNPSVDRPERWSADFIALTKLADLMPSYEWKIVLSSSWDEEYSRPLSLESHLLYSFVYFLPYARTSHFVSRENALRMNVRPVRGKIRVVKSWLWGNPIHCSNFKIQLGTMKEERWRIQNKMKIFRVIWEESVTALLSIWADKVLRCLTSARPASWDSDLCSVDFKWQTRYKNRHTSKTKYVNKLKSISMETAFDWLLHMASSFEDFVLPFFHMVHSLILIFF